MVCFDIHMYAFSDSILSKYRTKMLSQMHFIQFTTKCPKKLTATGDKCRLAVNFFDVGL